MWREMSEGKGDRYCACTTSGFHDEQAGVFESKAQRFLCPFVEIAEFLAVVEHLNMTQAITISVLQGCKALACEFERHRTIFVGGCTTVPTSAIALALRIHIFNLPPGNDEHGP